MPEDDQLDQEDCDDSSGKLSDRTVLVTGAGSGLGTAFCLSVSKAGAKILLLDRKRRQMEETCQRVEAYGSDPTVIEFDLAKAGEADYQSLAAGLAGMIQVLDCVVHCGLSAWPLAPVVNSKIENWYRIHDREAVQPMVLIRSLYPLLRKSVGASVVFCTMSAGRKGRANWGAVGSAFAALENISETLTEEWESENIRVNTLDISSMPSALRTRYYPGEVITQPNPDNDYGLDHVLGDLLRSDSTTSGQRIIVDGI